MGAFGMPGPNGPWRERKAYDDTRDHEDGDGYRPSNDKNFERKFAFWFGFAFFCLFLMGKCVGGPI